jgi:hypothetical protein
LRGLIRIAHGCRGVDLDELLIDPTRKVLLIIEDVGLASDCEGAAQQKEGTRDDKCGWTYSG